MGKDLKGKELGVGICQRKNGKYCARYTDRFGCRKSIYDDKLSDVRNKLAIAIAENQTFSSIKDNVKLDVWFDRWVDVYKRKSVRPGTLLIYTHIYKKNISPYLGNYNINSIVKSDVQNLIHKASDKGYSYERQSKIKLILSDMFSKAMDDDLMVKNPAKGVKLDDKKVIKARALSISDQETFFECCAGTFYDNLFNVAVNTGLRPGELFALTEGDIDFNNNLISVSKTLVYQKYLDEDCKNFHIEDPKTKQSYRKVPMNSICKKYMEKQIMQKNVISRKRPKEQCDFLFTTQFNTPINSSIYSSAIKSIVDTINMMRDVSEEIQSFGGHTFRHTFATRCFEAGVQPKVVQSYLGHATLQMTMDLYTHIMEEKASNDIELIVPKDDNVVEFEKYVV